MAIDMKKDNYPMLILGEAKLLFLKGYKGKIDQVSSLDDLRSVIEYYTGLENIGRLVVINDIGFLPKQCTGLLLKFVEETKLQLVLLSLVDNISPILLSRCKLVVKRNSKTESKFSSTESCLHQLENLQDSSSLNRLNIIAEYCPMVYYYEQKIGNDNKIFPLLGVDL